ncbi:MAG: 3-5 exonuclease [Ramlibacter sp.]|jgi:predicted PolB exonuclease-like 3'-5' exonuclease|uniref:3'-5' exonuclease n=1 Tax=Ramlibacter sp. TaxID=1917967 RepID=UPI0026051A31|nr:3'-5' exonuclease [Ramlibacter sp.]MDB5750909.1 3-5 exonuclease [Ramlibacter sp.]
MPWPVLVFDIESIPDIAGLRLLRGVPADIEDPQVYADWAAERKAANQSDFMPLYLQRILVISCVFRNADGLRVHSFVDRDGGSEGKVIQTFFNALEKHTPQLVSWNGSGFDLPVLHYRGLRHGVAADRYWCMGEGGAPDDREFKYNNYINRYHMRHMDLMDVLALYNGRANAPMDALAKLCGFPGKLGMDGSQVYGAYRDGKLEDIRRYCETDVMNTYLLYCRFQKMRCGFTEAEYEQEIGYVKQTIGELAPLEPHWQEYLAAWK